MSLLVRSSQLAARSRVFVQARGMHGEYKHMPFDYSNKAVFGTKLGLYLFSGFMIPFGAAAYQLSKH